MSVTPKISPEILKKGEECILKNLEEPTIFEKWLKEHEYERVGEPENGHDCPIHNFLHALCPELPYIDVEGGPSGIIISSYEDPTYADELGAEDPVKQINPPDWVLDFISEFDHDSGLDRPAKGGEVLMVLNHIEGWDEFDEDDEDEEEEDDEEEDE